LGRIYGWVKTDMLDILRDAVGGLIMLGLIGIGIMFILTTLQFALGLISMLVIVIACLCASIATWITSLFKKGKPSQEPNAGPELQFPTAVREVDFDSPLNYRPLGAERPQFSVCFSFQDGTVRNFVRGTDCQTAIRRAKEITEWPGAQDGSIKRVIITNGNNDPIFEWTYGQGVTFAKFSNGL
jgi:hypothetical protein